MNKELRIRNEERQKKYRLFHVCLRGQTSYFILHTSSAKQGQAMTIAAVFFLIISLTVVLGVVAPVMSQVESVRAVERGAESLYAAEGALQDVVYRLISGQTVDAVEKIDYGTVFGTATTTMVFDGKEILSAGDRSGFTRKSKAHLSTGSGASFNYGMQSGEGGVILENSASVSGNIYSNGPIIGAGGNLVKGDAVSAGPSGSVSGIHATSSVYAHTIADSSIDRDAYYQSISGTTVLGALHPGSPDQATSSLPIASEQISQWEADAEAGGVISSPCPYEIEDDITLGPKKIACDLEISGDPTVTLTGALWVTGNIIVKNTAVVAVSSSLIGQSIPVIADKPTDRITSSKITLENSALFQGSGSGSYVLFLSQNKSASIGGSEKAIVAKNTVDGDLLLFAGQGEIELDNSIDVKEVTAWRVRLKNSAEVLYETGLANLLFTGGPGGGYTLDAWREIE